MERTLNFTQLGGYENTFFYGHAVSAISFIYVLQESLLVHLYWKDVVNYPMVLIFLCAIFYINLLSFFHLWGNPLVITSGAIGWFKVEVRSKYSVISSFLYLGLLLFYNPFVFFELNEFQVFSIGIFGLSLNVYEFIKWDKRRVIRKRKEREYENKRRKKRKLIIQLIDSSNWSELNSLYKPLDYGDLMHILIHCKGPDYVTEKYQELMNVWMGYTDWSKFGDDEQYYDYCVEQYKKVMEPYYRVHTRFLN